MPVEKKAALGFRVKSGRAIAVLVSGSKNLPKVLDHRIILLSDPAQPDTIQPYFKGIEIITIKNGKIIERWGEWDGIDLLEQLGAI
ncbi:MAG: ester cyclase [candidate division Zixibacteria bacterium]|nr:ester cyclase [candidate division Zixibacteria bacterium]